MSQKESYTFTRDELTNLLKRAVRVTSLANETLQFSNIESLSTAVAETTLLLLDCKTDGEIREDLEFSPFERFMIQALR